MNYRPPVRPRRGARARGFTLVELMIVLAIAAILLTLAVPSFTDFVKNNRMVAQNNDFVTALNLARSEAIRRGSRVTVCSSGDGATCAAGGWEQGWIVFVDANGDGTVDDPDNGILRVHGPLAGGTTLTGVAALATHISYTALGTTRPIGGGAAATQVGALVLCDDRGFGNKARAIQINSTGRVSSTVADEAGSGATSCTP